MLIRCYPRVRHRSRGVSASKYDEDNNASQNTFNCSYLLNRIDVTTIHFTLPFTCSVNKDLFFTVRQYCINVEGRKTAQQQGVRENALTTGSTRFLKEVHPLIEYFFAIIPQQCTDSVFQSTWLLLLSICFRFWFFAVVFDNSKW